jgi:hypothetical protein
VNRKLFLITAVVFFAIQVLALHHLAEYKFVKHKHSGELCSVNLLGKQPQDTAPQALDFQHRIFLFLSFIPFPPQPSLNINTFSPTAPRGPPEFLPS